MNFKYLIFIIFLLPSCAPKTNRDYIVIDSELSEEWKMAITDAVSDWCEASQGEICPEIYISNEGVTISNIWDESMSETKLAYYNARSGVITFNKNSPELEPYFRKVLIATHELGHMFGPATEHIEKGIMQSAPLFAPTGITKEDLDFVLSYE